MGRMKTSTDTRCNHETGRTHSQTETPSRPAAATVSVGRLVGFDASGNPLVAHDFESLEAPEPALSVVPLTEALIGKDVAVSRLANAPVNLLIMGVVQPPLGKVGEAGKAESDPADDSRPVLEVDGQTFPLHGEREIALRCGKSSITLTRSGKILIKGEYVLSRASGTNRILGGSIQLN